MLNINFHPEAETPEGLAATEKYRRLWHDEKIAIHKAFEKVSGLIFSEVTIHALVADRKSQSHPLILRSDLSEEKRKATLIHELGHRLLADNREIKKQGSERNHRDLYLILYDVWKELYGEEFAERSCSEEMRLPDPMYRLAWEWALGLGEEGRQDEFKKLYSKLPI